uniref:Uncharacterized protein n=1 Tax=Plectus sambesii TaxID=2011161 RepID=A0A914UZ58_9BILA
LRHLDAKSTIGAHSYTVLGYSQYLSIRNNMLRQLAVFFTIAFAAIVAKCSSAVCILKGFEMRDVRREASHGFPAACCHL